MEAGGETELDIVGPTSFTRYASCEYTQVAGERRIVLDFIREGGGSEGLADEGTHLGITRRYNLGDELRADGVYLILS